MSVCVPEGRVTAGPEGRVTAGPEGRVTAGPARPLPVPGTGPHPDPARCPSRASPFSTGGAKTWIKSTGLPFTAELPGEDGAQLCAVLELP